MVPIPDDTGPPQTPGDDTITRTSRLRMYGSEQLPYKTGELAHPLMT